MAFEHTLSPWKIGNVEIKNRMCVSPMGSGEVLETVGYGGAFTDRGIRYYEERARGGFGAIFLPAFMPDNKADAHDPLTAMLNYPDYFRKQGLLLNERMSYFGTKTFQQLSLGLGRDDGFLAASPTPQFFNPDEPNPFLTTEQIKQKVESVVQAAKLCKDSGFTGVEVHAIHWGYLMDELAMPLMNWRTDEYGGSLENRIRTAKECVEGIKQVCGSDFPVTMRLGLKTYIRGFNQPSLDGDEEAGRTLEESLEIAKLLEQYGYDALNVDTGTYDSFYYACPPQYMPFGHVIPLAEECKRVVDIPVICGSRMNRPEMAEKAIAEGKIDAYVIGRATLADPQYAKKIEMGRPEKIRPCIGCTVGCIGKVMNGEAVNCAVNPAARNELNYNISRSLEPKKAAVVGGGVAGMEAARTLKLRGFDVTIYEKTDKLGGNLLPAGAHAFKIELYQLVDWYKQELETLGVPVVYHCEMTAEKLKNEIKPDVALLAVGSVPVMPESIRGIDHPKCDSCVAALRDHKELGNKIVVAGAGLVGCEFAIDKAMEGFDVTIVEAASDILSAGATGTSTTIMVAQMIPDLMEKYNVKLITDHRIVEVNDEGAVIEPAAGGKQITVPADNVVLSIGMRAVPNFADELKGSGIEAFVIGDAHMPGNVYSSVQSAYAVAKNL